MVYGMIKFMSELRSKYGNTQNRLGVLCEENEELLNKLREYIIQNPDDLNKHYTLGATPLSFAMSLFGMETVRCLLECKADPNIIEGENFPRYLLSSCCFDKSKQKYIPLLLEYKADPNLHVGSDTNLMLLCAVKGDESLENFKSLVERGVDIHSKDIRSQTVLFDAVNHNNSKIIGYLLDKKMDVNERDSQNRTPLLHSIVNRCDASTIKLLLENKADIFAVDNEGKNCFQMNYNDTTITDMLLEENNRRVREQTLKEVLAFLHLSKNDVPNEISADIISIFS